MKFLGMKKVRDGKYLKNYELSYENKAGRLKTYEIVSRKELEDVQDLGRRASGVSIVAFQDGKMLLLREFRMSINKTIFNLCAGMQEKGETIEECIRRELYEETGLSVKKVLKILPPSYSAVGFSDTKTYIAFVEAGGDFSDHTSDNEEISARFYSREEVKALLETQEFSSRSQIAAFFFTEGAELWNKNDLKQEDEDK